MSTEKNRKPGTGVYFLPLLVAAPILAAATLGIWRFGPKLLKLLNILIKMVVKA